MQFTIHLAVHYSLPAKGLQFQKCLLWNLNVQLRIKCSIKSLASLFTMYWHKIWQKSKNSRAISMYFLLPPFCMQVAGCMKEGRESGYGQGWPSPAWHQHIQVELLHAGELLFATAPQKWQKMTLLKNCGIMQLWTQIELPALLLHRACRKSTISNNHSFYPVTCLEDYSDGNCPTID